MLGAQPVLELRMRLPRPRGTYNQSIMPRIELLTEIDAPRDRVFDLARSIDLHTESMNRSREYAAAASRLGHASNRWERADLA